MLANGGFFIILLNRLRFFVGNTSILSKSKKLCVELLDIPAQRSLSHYY